VLGGQKPEDARKENIKWFFNLHNKNKDGYLTKDEVLTLSESFLVSLSSFADVQR
jgi:Ca2+-binding EF-hand superfamily protein